MNRAAALLVATVALSTLAGCSGGSDAPAVVIVIGDTVRADHLSAYGYERATSPALEQLAAEGVRFDAAYAQSSWTLPTIATILTGQPPHRHGAGRVERAVRPLFPDVPTIAERLRLAGWETAAFVNVVWLDPKSGLARGFDTYDLRLTDASNLNPRNAAATTDDALGWLEGQARDEPFLLVVHYFDPHMTYDPPAPWDTEFDEAAAEIERGFVGPADLRDSCGTTGERRAHAARPRGALRRRAALHGRAVRAAAQGTRAPGSLGRRAGAVRRRSRRGVLGSRWVRAWPHPL